MVSLGCFSSYLLDPFLVLTAKREGRLMKEWSTYDGPAKVVFQPSHWMDTIIAKKYLDWLREKYPGEKIGLVWDHAGPHISQEVVAYAHHLGIVIEYI